MGWGAFAGPAIGGLFGLAGGLLNGGSQSGIAAAQMAMQQQQFNDQMQFAKQQYGDSQLWQKGNWDFMVNQYYHQIGDRVQDAKAAGVSPLVALGAQPYNMGPVSSGPTPLPSPTATGGIQGGSGLGEGLSHLGQDISRAQWTTMTDEEKANLVARTELVAKQGQEADARIDLSQAQAAYYRSRASTPSFPSAGVDDSGRSLGGQGNLGTSTFAVRPSAAGGYVNEPNQRTTSDPTNRGSTSGPGAPDVNWRRTQQGGLAMEPTPGSVAGTIGGTAYDDWNWRNRLPQWNNMNYPSKAKMESEFGPGITGAYFSPMTASWYPLKKGESPPWYYGGNWNRVDY